MIATCLVFCFFEKLTVIFFFFLSFSATSPFPVFFFQFKSAAVWPQQLDLLTSNLLLLRLIDLDLDVFEGSETVGMF